MNKSRIRTILIIVVVGLAIVYFRARLASSPYWQNIANPKEENTAEMVSEEDDEEEEAFRAFHSTEEVIEDFFSKYDVSPDQVSIAYYHLQNGDQYVLNENEIVNAASTTKVATAMLFADLIAAGELDWESELPYYDSYYEEGEGAITNLEKRDSYPIDELIYEMLVHSDNTATNILALYYIDYYGNYWEAMTNLSGVEEVNPVVNEGNYSTAEILAQTLIRLTEEEKYGRIVSIMQEAQTGFRLKKYIEEGMAAKYGTYDEWAHDIGVFYEGETPLYVIVVLTRNLENVDEYIAELGLQLNEWQYWQSEHAG